MRYAFLSRVLPFVAVTAFALAPLPALASLYDSLVVFGDSLSDNGNNASSFAAASDAQTGVISAAE